MPIEYAGVIIPETLSSLSFNGVDIERVEVKLNSGADPVCVWSVDEEPEPDEG